ncbi:hypothetical protein E0Z10_g2151 [Xylaria hypoxylon]|uniref:Uncharacterized protein n=1 Tax=Xylaria hypoxylon TaxID=37992 RepID=A0A4Z0YRJ6_9PEZI|nr:hypothetical protein E0Z10_g2151 [Xylaria hypoxylon]
MCIQEGNPILGDHIPITQLADPTRFLGRITQSILGTAIVSLRVLAVGVLLQLFLLVVLVVENASTQADASAATLSESASGISCEQDPTTTSISLLYFNTNQETVVQVSVRKHDDVYQTNDAPSNERIKQESEDDNPPSLHDDDKQLSLSPSLPETEYQANLLAAAEDSRYLFEEYYKRTHGDSKNEADDAADTYWRWDVERQQWFHTDTGTQSVVWFMG